MHCNGAVQRWAHISADMTASSALVQDDCAYHCMHAQESFRASNGFEPWKYFGKWPFYRVLGAALPHNL